MSDKRLYLAAQRIHGRILKKKKRGGSIQPSVTGINLWDPTLSKLQENIK